MTEQPYPALDASAYLTTRTTLDALAERYEQRAQRAPIWSVTAANLLDSITQLDTWAREEQLISDGQLADMVEVSLQRLLELPPALQGRRGRSLRFWRRNP